MTWKVDRDQNNKGHNLVEFEFVDFPGHVIGHFSNDLIKPWKKEESWKSL